MQEGALWQAVLGEIELSVSRANFQTWFKKTELLRSADNQLVVGVPNIFVKNQLERKFNDLILEVLGKNGVKPGHIEYKIHSVSTTPTNSRDDSASFLTKEPKPTPATVRGVTH